MSKANVCIGSSSSLPPQRLLEPADSYPLEQKNKQVGCRENMTGCCLSDKSNVAVSKCSTQVGRQNQSPVKVADAVSTSSQGPSTNPIRNSVSPLNLSTTWKAVRSNATLAAPPRSLRGVRPPRFSRETLQKLAIGISVVSIAYNGLEGGISIGFGQEDDSKALLFFGLQSCVEVASAGLVVWRFTRIAPPGAEQARVTAGPLVRREKVATVAIGGLLGALSASAIGISIYSLVKESRPTETLPGLIISGTALGLMILIWAPKPWLAKSLNSSSMKGEAKCSLACISMTSALLVGTLVNRVWKGGWWVDSVTSIVLALFFGKESYQMIRWGLSVDFSGGCCRTCETPQKSEQQDELSGRADVCEMTVQTPTGPQYLDSSAVV